MRHRRLCLLGAAVCCWMADCVVVSVADCCRDGAEQLSVDRALRALSRAEVVVMVVEASDGVTQQVGHENTHHAVACCAVGPCRLTVNTGIPSPLPSTIFRNTLDVCHVCSLCCVAARISSQL